MTLLPATAAMTALKTDDVTNVTMLNWSSVERNAGHFPGFVMPLAEAIVFSFLMSICIVVTIVGNILVVLSVFTYRPLRNVPNFLIISLACADLAVATLVMPFNIVNFVVGSWMFGGIFCNMWLTFDILTCTASILNLCAIALDRYNAIHDPLNYAQKRTLRRVLITIAIVWGTSAVISVPPLIGWNNGLFNEINKVCELTTEPGYVIYSASGSFYIPLIIMTFVYVKIFLATRRRLRERAKAASAAKLRAATGKEQPPSPKADMSSSETPDDVDHDGTTLNCDVSSKGASKPEAATNNSSSTKKENLNATKSQPLQVHQFYEEKQRISLSKERRAARTLGIIMGSFVACWLPFFLMYVIIPFCTSCAQTDPRIVNFIVWLGYINSTLNPVIYTIFNIDFRKAFKRLLQGKCSVGS